MYQPGTGSNIGTLLRLIQEEQAVNPLNVKPSSDPNSPLRELVQGPLQSPEDPGSSRVVSVRPEGVTGESVEGQVITPGGSPVLPSSSSVIAPKAYVPPVQTAPQGNPNQISENRPSSISTPTVQSLPSIGTKITSAPRSAVLGVSTGAIGPFWPSNIPQRGRSGILVSPSLGKTGKPAPTPTPSQQKGKSSGYRGYTA